MEPNPFLPLPEPNDEPQPDSPPSERPRRRRIMQPVFRTGRLRTTRRPSRLLVASLAVCITIAVQAQTTPARTTPAAATPPHGWVQFDDKVGRDLNIPADQLQQLRDVDGRYQRDYSALGNDPVLSPQYRELTDRRNADVQHIMTPETYTQWNLKYNVPGTIQNNPTGPTGTSTPTPPKP